jgi:hypothetical protein
MHAETKAFIIYHSETDASIIINHTTTTFYYQECSTEAASLRMARLLLHYKPLKVKLMLYQAR